MPVQLVETLLIAWAVLGVTVFIPALREQVLAEPAVAEEDEEARRELLVTAVVRVLAA